MKSQNTSPELFTLAADANSQLSHLVNQPLWIDIVDSWHIDYSLKINCNEEKEEHLRLNVTFGSQFGGHYSYGTYISKTHSTTTAMNGIIKAHSEYLGKMEINKAKADAKAKEDAILALVKEGKFDEAKALSLS